MDESLIIQVRDVLVSVYLTAGILVLLALAVLAFVVARAVRRLINAVAATVENVNGTLDNVNEASKSALRFMRSPSGEGSTASFANGLGMLISLVAGLRGRSK